jgi:aspartate/methionine/tyrosine aminotransferase
VLLASPSNPTGTSIAPARDGRHRRAVRARGGVTIVDEIYLGLSYDEAYGHSALALGEDVISVNSFSKYFSMTGWRLGWLVLPPRWCRPVEKLAQNLYICASRSRSTRRWPASSRSPRRLRAAARRVPRAARLRRAGAEGALGLPVPVVPDGAFYAWADCSAHSASSWDFCFDMMLSARTWP